VDKSASAKKELIVKIELFVIFAGSGVDRKCRHGSLPAARRAIPENICSSRAFPKLTDAVEKGLRNGLNDDSC
jgi:hypothetical protein